MAAGPSQVERLLRPLDKLRRSLIFAFMDWIKPLIVDRERRIAVTALLLMTSALLMAMTVPLWVLAIGPILWGIPHVVGDVRYLAIRTGYFRRKNLWLFAGIPLILAGCISGVPWLMKIFHSSATAGFLASLGALWVSYTTPRKRLIGTLLLGTLMLLAYQWGYYADLVFAHAHNFIAVALWWAWRRRQERLHWLPMSFFAIACVGLLMGMADPFLHFTNGLFWAPKGGSIHYHMYALTPGFSMTWGSRIVVLFAFAQSIHYLVWIRLIPEEDRPQPTPRTFAGSYRALKQDFGGLALLLTTLGVFALFGWALYDLMQARTGYLRLVLFHGHLELVAATLLWAEDKL